jgi:hypothetical protein
MALAAPAVGAEHHRQGRAAGCHEDAY